MAGSLRTANYNLCKYAPGDITSWLVDFNGNMDKIDKQMKANADGNTGIDGEVAALTQRVTSAEESIEDLNNSVSNLDSVTTPANIVPNPSSNVNLIGGQINKLCGLVSGAIYISSGKTGNALSTIDYSEADRKLLPIMTIAGNPLEIETIQTPTKNTITTIGTSLYGIGDSSSNTNSNVGVVYAYFNGTNTLICLSIATAYLTAGYVLYDTIVNINYNTAK